MLLEAALLLPMEPPRGGGGGTARLPREALLPLALLCSVRETLELYVEYERAVECDGAVERDMDTCLYVGPESFAFGGKSDDEHCERLPTTKDNA